jgi:HSP20 family protein
MSEKTIEVKKTPVSHAQLPATWRSFRNEMERFFDHGFRGHPFWHMFDVEPFWSHNGSLEFATPAVDASVDDKTYKITAELPGLDEKNIEVTLSGDELILKGEKRQDKEERDQSFYVSERAYGTFRRSFHLPENVDRDKIAADFTKGVLTITIPKTAEAQKPAKKIDVKAA